jgi:peroxiredoxin
MIKHSILIRVLMAVTIILSTIPAMAEEAAVNEPAPLFSAQDILGTNYSLADLKGKIVVLEWFNHGCPFVIRHYGGHMQELQKTYTAKGVVWLSICSSAEGKQGYQTVDQANVTVDAKGIAATAVILDPEGEIGLKYGAKTTPHMFVIDPQGVLVYNGAIDDSPRGDAAAARNYVRSAVDALMSGQPVPLQTSPPYGCSVKYK